MPQGWLYKILTQYLTRQTNAVRHRAGGGRPYRPNTTRRPPQLLLKKGFYIPVEVVF